MNIHTKDVLDVLSLIFRISTWSCHYFLREIFITIRQFVLKFE